MGLNGRTVHCINGECNTVIWRQCPPWLRHVEWSLSCEVSRPEEGMCNNSKLLALRRECYCTFTNNQKLNPGRMQYSICILHHCTCIKLLFSCIASIASGHSTVAQFLYKNSLITVLITSVICSTGASDPIAHVFVWKSHITESNYLSPNWKVVNSWARQDRAAQKKR